MKACLDEEESDIDDCPICMERKWFAFDRDIGLTTGLAIVDDRRVTSCAHEFCSGMSTELVIRRPLLIYLSLHKRGAAKSRRGKVRYLTFISSWIDSH